MEKGVTKYRNGGKTSGNTNKRDHRNYLPILTKF